MKILKIVALLSMVIAFSIASYCYVTNGYVFTKTITKEDLKEIINEGLYDEFVYDVKKINRAIKSPIYFDEGITVNRVNVEGNTLVYHLNAKESYRPGEENGISEQEAVDMLKEALKLTFCNKSYFQKLPLSVEFRFSVEELPFDSNNLVIIAAKSKEVCE